MFMISHLSFFFFHCFNPKTKVICLFHFQGEAQKKMDVLSNEVFVKALISSGQTVSPSKFSASIGISSN